ncbi:MAG: PP2C family protein-serine/threonine phosphatase [Thermoleophilia bacterium]
MLTDRTALRVLLIEDDDGDALLVRAEMEDVGAFPDLRRVGTLAEAMAELGPGVDCVLLDLGLPDASGLDALAALRTAFPGLAIVVLTGLDDEQAGAAAVRAGAQDFLVKGQVGGDTLTRAIRYAVSRSEVQRAQRELEVAEVRAAENARLERGLLPRPAVRDPGLAVATFSRPGRRRALLGGDFYDVVETGDGTVHIVIGDVCGHGPDEAALGVSLRSAWRALVLAAAPGHVVLTTLQEVLVRERHREHLFATVCTIALAPDRRTIEVRRAGHLPPLMLDETGASPLPDRPGGRPLGLGGDEWPAFRWELPERWALLLYTDGLTEARLADGGGLLGEGGLQALVHEHLVRPADGDARARLEALTARVEHLHGGPLHDDVAALLVGDAGGPAGT